jgi:undecaprenyl-diphosphatase
VITYLILGVIQGLTEFLPVSSSGHLVLAERLFGFSSPGLVCEACLHLGTLAAVLLAFHADVADLARAFSPRGSVDRRKEIGFLVLATVPIIVAGLPVRGSADRWFHSLWVVGIGWLATAVFLLLADGRARRAAAASPTAVGALGIGVAQAVSLVPGVSRSGFTMSAGILAGLSPERAARFSFILSIPAVAGAAALTLWDAARSSAPGDVNVAGLLLGTVVAFAVGLVALRAFLRLVARGRWAWFAAYCAALSITAILLAAFS